MTEDKIQALKDDIAFMRALAQEGSSAPLLFGGVLFSAGLIFGAGAVGHWLIASGALKVSGWAYLINWGLAGVAFGVVMSVILNRSKGRPGYSAGINKATGVAWSGVGFAIFTLFLGLTVIGLVTGDWSAMAVIPVVIFALYGTCWFIAGSLSHIGWIKGVAFASYAAAVGMAALTGNPYQMLAYAAGLILLATLPGLILMRQEPTDVV